MQRIILNLIILIAMLIENKARRTITSFTMKRNTLDQRLAHQRRHDAIIKHMLAEQALMNMNKSQF